jgi:hypothetical protein
MGGNLPESFTFVNGNPKIRKPFESVAPFYRKASRRIRCIPSVYKP